MTTDATTKLATVDERGRRLALVKPSERRDAVLKPYIAHRLREECDPPVGEKRGRAAAIAEEIGFRPATVSAVKDEKRGISDDFVVAIAKHWRISLGELDRLADEHAAEQARRAETEDTSAQARLMRLIEQEAEERGSLTADQLRRATSLAAFGGKITRADVRKAIDRKDDGVPIDSDLEREHTVSRGKRKRSR